MASRSPVGSVVTPMPAASRWHQGPQAVQRSPHLSEVPTPPQGPHTSPKSPSVPKTPRLSHFLLFHTVTGKDKHCLLAKDTSGHFGRTPFLLSPAPARAAPPWGSRDEASSGQPQRPRGTDNVSVPQNTQRRSCKSTRDTLGLLNPQKNVRSSRGPTRGAELWDPQRLQRVRAAPCQHKQGAQPRAMPPPQPSLPALLHPSGTRR